MSDSLQPHGLYSPQNSLGQNTSPADLPDPGIGPGRVSCIAGDSLPTELSGKPTLKLTLLTTVFFLAYLRNSIPLLYLRLCLSERNAPSFFFLASQSQLFCNYCSAGMHFPPSRFPHQLVFIPLFVICLTNSDMMTSFRLSQIEVRDFGLDSTLMFHRKSALVPGT